jgi:hypothetical protein
MIRHCVFVKLKANTSAEEREGLTADLAALKDVIPSITAAHFSSNVSPEGLGRGYNFGFVMDFIDAAARDGYLPHPAHEKAAGRLVAACEGGAEGVLVYDLEI